MRIRGFATVLASLLALTAVGCVIGDEQEPDESRGKKSASGLPPGWTQLAAPPQGRASAAAVWTGSELFYWGGYTYDGARNDGAAFDLATRSWRPLPPAPLEARYNAAAIWTGREVLVWSGSADTGPARAWADGASYTPATRAWELLPPAPLSPRMPVVAVWSGRELIVWGEATRPTAARDGAAYNPSTRGWRRLRPAPFALNQAEAVWTGEEMVVFGSMLGINNNALRGRSEGLAYNPATDKWRTLPPVELSPQASSIAWIDGKALAWDYLLDAALYDPVSDAWEALPELPLDAAECYPTSARSGEVVVAWYCGQGSLFDIERRSWQRLEPPKAAGYGRPTPAGDAVFFVGAAKDGSENALWAYVPR